MNQNQTTPVKNMADDLREYLELNRLFLNYAASQSYLLADEWLVVAATPRDCPPHPVFTFERLQAMAVDGALLVARYLSATDDCLQVTAGRQLSLQTSATTGGSCRAR